MQDAPLRQTGIGFKAFSISFAVKAGIIGVARLERGDSADAVTATPLAGSWRRDTLSI